MTDLGRYRTVFTGVAGTPWYSNMHFDDSPDTPGFYGEFVADFWRAIANSFSAAVTWTVEQEVFYFPDGTGNTTQVASWDGDTGTGAQPGDRLPPANQALITWRTGVYSGGREIRGKTFVGGICETESSNGLLTAGTRDAMLAAANELISDGNGAFRIYSPTNATSAVITSAQVSTEFAVLRSRRD